MTFNLQKNVLFILENYSINLNVMPHSFHGFSSKKKITILNVDKWNDSQKSEALTLLEFYQRDSFGYQWKIPLSERHHLTRNVSLANGAGIVADLGGNGPLAWEDGFSMSTADHRD